MSLVLTVSVAHLQAGDYLIGSGQRIQSVLASSLAGKRLVVVARWDGKSRVVSWNAKTTMRVERSAS